MLMRIAIPTLAWPTERYPTKTLLNSTKSFTYGTSFVAASALREKSNCSYTRVRPSVYIALMRLRLAAADVARAAAAALTSRTLNHSIAATDLANSYTAFAIRCQ